jgi:hypothetical protein
MSRGTSVRRKNRGENYVMPVKLTTTIAKISSISNCTNKELLDEFNQYMKSIGT